MALLHKYAPALAGQQIVFQFNEQQLVASLFGYANNALVHETTKTYEIHHAIIDGKLINRMKVQNAITDFINVHRAKNMALSFIFNEPIVHQEIVYRPEKEIQHYIKQKWQTYEAQAYYLFSWEHEFCFYVCAIEQPILFSYLLLASGRPLQTITTRFASLLPLYKKQQKNPVSQAQLAITLRANNHMLPIDYALLANNLKLSDKDAELIGPAIGALL